MILDLDDITGSMGQYEVLVPYVVDRGDRDLILSVTSWILKCSWGGSSGAGFRRFAGWV